MGGCADDALTLVSILSSEGVWYRPSRQNGHQVHDAQMAQEKFMHRLGDYLTLLNVYRKWENNGCSADWCKSHYLHHRALRQAKDIKSQLREQLSKTDVRLQDNRKNAETGLLKALCAGFYM